MDYTEKSNISELINQFKSPKIIGSLFILLIFYSVSFFLDLSSYYIIPLAVPVVVLGLYLFFKNPVLWIYTVIISSPFFLTSRGEDFGPAKIIPYAFMLPGIIVWFINHLLIRRERIVRNPGDFIYILFIFFLSFNVIIGIINEADMLNWLREYFVYFMYLLYFPARYYIKTKKQLDIFLILVAYSLIFVSLSQLYFYKMAMSNALYMYQVMFSLRDNITFLTFGIIFGIVFFFKEKGKFLKVYYLLTGLLCTITIITTFARTMWIIGLFLFVLSFFIFNRRQKFQYIIAILGSIILLYIIGSFVFKANVNTYFSLINKKFSSSTKGVTDPSVLTRIYEYKAVFDKIEENPLAGNGIAKDFVYYDLLQKATSRKAFTHNSYFLLAYTAGIPTTIVFICFLIYYSYVSCKRIYKYRFSDQRFYYYLGLVGYLVGIISSFASGMFMNKETALMMIISTFFINLENQVFEKATIDESHLMIENN